MRSDLRSKMEENNVIEPLQDDASLEDEHGHQQGGTSDYEPSLAESAFASVTPSVAAHVYRNGRRYHHFRAGQYPLPNDEDEHYREVLRHEMLKRLLDQMLYLAPMPKSPQRIIDLGTGFGYWAKDIAEEFPSAQVIGVDLSPVQPDWVPPNLEFRIDDIESEWRHGENYDYVHLRFTGVVVKDHDKLVANIYESLKPGGWFEVQDVYPKMFCDDGTIPEEFAPNVLYDLIAQHMEEETGYNIYWVETLQPRLEQAGFVNIQRRVYNIPIGQWTRDPNLRTLGFYWREVVAGFHEAMTARMNTATTKDLLYASFEAMQDSRIHAYVPIYFVWAQKPSLA